MDRPPPFLKTPVGGAVIMVSVIVAFFVLREHWSHVVGNLAYLILLACPLMHLFGHGHGHRHGGHGGHGGPPSSSQGGSSPPNPPGSNQQDR